MTMGRADILGVQVSAINMGMALQAIDRWIAVRHRTYVCVSGVHGVMESHRDAAVRRAHNQAGLVTPDGMPLVWLLKLSGYRFVERVYGPDLMLATFAWSETRGYRHFLYGTTDATLERLTSRLSQRFPRSQIVGRYSPPFRPLSSAEADDAVAAINRSGADIVWVGLSTPAQERWMAEIRSRLEAPVLIGVGAAFNFHAGIVRQAPRIIQRSGLEWLFRLLQEPRRLWRRYLKNNPMFVALVIAQKIGMKRFPEPEKSAGV
jgi:N-acetylglucosaminyldiphosphoundecaprenol N-acetyl-beta-D-mannosaminyltransferase